MIGAFAGYNYAIANFMVGAEIAALAGAANEVDLEDQYEYTSFVDLKARAGVNSGQFMPYALIGASIGTLAVDEEGRPDRNFEQTETGILFGLGADVAVNDQFAIGAEFISRRFEFDFGDVPLVDMEAGVNSIALRASYRF